MNANLHLGLAFIVATAIHGGPFMAIRRSAAEREPAALFTGIVGPRVNVYDYQRSDTISGRLQGATYHLYDALTYQRLRCTIHGADFDGIDDQNQTLFCGRVEGVQIELYDAEFETTYVFTAVPVWQRRSRRHSPLHY